MKKKELLELPALRATKGMLELAAKDELKPIGNLVRVVMCIMPP